MVTRWSLGCSWEPSCVPSSCSISRSTLSTQLLMNSPRKESSYTFRQYQPWAKILRSTRFAFYLCLPLLSLYRASISLSQLLTYHLYSFSISFHIKLSLSVYWKELIHWLILRCEWLKIAYYPAFCKSGYILQSNNFTSDRFDTIVFKIQEMEKDTPH